MFDPTYPATNALIESAPLRGQFNGLKALIDAVPTLSAAQVDGTTTLPAGAAAVAQVSVSGSTLHFTFDLPQGAQGLPFAQAVVDAVSTLDPGQPATVGVSFDGADVRFTFAIPRGFDGTNGSNGSDGAQGPPGTEGAQGPRGNDGPPGSPFAQAVVDSVTTLDPGQQATVGVSFDGTNVHFAFGLPRGSDGSNGAPGPPGEVSLAQLNGAIAGTSTNTNAVSTLDTPFANDPPTLADMELLRGKMNELILNGRR
jgi:hypothetical protein